MRNSKTHDKSFTQNQKQQQNQTQDSKTKVHFSESAVYKYMSGKREPISIRIDSGLYSAFKPLSKRIFGSTCKAIEIYMITLIEAVENGVHFSNTEKPIQIEKIVIERGLRERRKLEVEASEGDKCHFCGRVAVGKFRYVKTGLVYPLCGFHAKEMLDTKSWSVVSGE